MKRNFQIALYNAELDLKKAELNVKCERVSVLIAKLFVYIDVQGHTWNRITNRQFEYLMSLRKKIYEMNMELYHKKLNEWED